MFNLLSAAISNVEICETIVDIVDQERHLRNKLFDNIHKRDMKDLVGEFYRHSNAVIANVNMCQTLNRLQCSHRVLMVLNYFILIIHICQIYMCLGKKLLDVYFVFHIVHTMILLIY